MSLETWPPDTESPGGLIRDTDAGPHLSPSHQMDSHDLLVSLGLVFLSLHKFCDHGDHPDCWVHCCLVHPVPTSVLAQSSAL